MAAAAAAAAAATTAAAAATVGDEPCRAGARECVVCLSTPAGVCCVPCGHVALCERDSVALLTASNEKQCPVCRSKIDRLLRVFF